MKNTVIFINAIRPATFEAIQKFENGTKRSFELVVFVDSKIKESILHRNGQHKNLDKVTFVDVDFDCAESILSALSPYENKIFAITSQYENSMHELQKIIPFTPYLQMPTETSITWSTEKKYMRELIGTYNPKLVPAFTEIHNEDELDSQIKKNQLSLPLIIKPSGLEGSLLVSKANTLPELKHRVHTSLKHIDQAYKTWIKRQKPFLLLEEFMEGDMYSVDTYVDGSGSCIHLPTVLVQTGYSSGYHDFFGYKRLTPSGLNDVQEKKAQEATEDGIRALGLRSITVHTELMKTASGWKIIELGPRIGGYRHQMYLKAFGVNHIVNDILNRGGEKPQIYSLPEGYSAVFNVYAKSEGTITKIHGIEEIISSESYINCTQNLNIGDQSKFARHNGDPVFEIELFNKDIERLDNDIQYVENIQIEIS